MRLMSTLLLLSIFVFAGCESYDSHCPPVLDLPEEGQAMDNRPFESAVAELNQAIAATPEWDKRESSRAWVRGLAELAIERADALEPWRSTGEISCGAIELCKLHVKRRAQIATDWRPGPATTADLNKDPEAQIERVRSERAWWRSYEAMPWLERYIAAGVHHDWLHRHAFPDMRADLQRVIDVPPPDMRAWEFQDIPPTIHEQYRIRAEWILKGLDEVANGTALPTSAP